MSQEVDVAIVGGGMVGAALALLLAEQARIAPGRIAILEPAPVAPPAQGAPIGLRVSAIAPLNRERLTRLAVWRRLDPQRIATIERMAVWHQSVPPDSPDVLRFDAAESGAAELGAMVENAALQSALLAECGQRGIALRSERLRALALDATGAHLQLDHGSLRAELVVGADGAASAVRGLLQLPAATRDYGQRAIVATVRPTRAHHGTAFQRFLSTGPLALLPLPGRQCSIVWSAAEGRAGELLALSPEEFGAALTAAAAGVLGKMELVGERAAFPLRRLAADRYVAPRVALVGDAAHVIHPLAGQGVNQGLEDAAVLAAQLAQRPPRESVGALAALRRYERERRAGNALVGGVVDGLDRLFTGAGPLGSWAAREGMAWVARSGLARRLLVRQAAAGRSWPRR
ncbi:MAG TPA: FAD-dependent monooxygenase [Steroidobacteraceae bacterium]|nr:FAD-dependent monooxygenase [Steroidobacteraceae bacterium]